MVELSKLRFRKKGTEIILSPLESDILKLLWKSDDIKVREMYNKLKKKRKIALTSIAVSLDRMHKKGIVDRSIDSGKGGMHYIYRTKESKQEFERSVVEGTVNKLIDSFGSTAVTYFNERFSKKRR